MKRENEDCVFEIIVGTYEEYLVGYKFVLTDDEPKLVQSVANHAHKGSLKCVAAYDRYLASGGSDESIHLYDFKERRQGGVLMHHTGTVTCMKFTPDGSHLVTCGEDGSIGIVAVGSWILRKIWTKAHKEMAVYWLTVHPSGRLALSIGADKTIKTWNLIKGKHAYTTNINSVSPRPELIEWSCCGEYFGLVYGTNVDIYSMATGGVNNTLKTGSRITCVTFMEDQKICVGTWEGAVRCYEFLTGDMVWEIEPKKDIRIKAVSVIGGWLVVGNSEGFIFVYALKKSKKPVEKTSVGTSCRITCLGISRLLSEEELKEVKKKRKKKRVRKTNLEEAAVKGGGERDELTVDPATAKTKKRKSSGDIEEDSRTIDLVSPKTKNRKSSGGGELDNQTVGLVTPKSPKNKIRKSSGGGDRDTRTAGSVTPKTKQRKSVGTPQNTWNVTPIPAGR